MKLTEENFEDIRWGVMCKEITLCETCDTVFKYSPNRKFCDVCKRKQRELTKESLNERSAKNMTA